MKRLTLLCVIFMVAIFGFSVGQATELAVWSSPDNADALFELAQNFTQAHPDVQIEVTPLSWEVLYPRILQDIT
ncbi:MAG: sugar ABC transporter substrate-binding protein, partial [Candidatus Atribacteria bacterium]|nr:sugar ABC transporter substrate-binding protein [Candidatus Atribacteria bacterium]